MYGGRENRRFRTIIVSAALIAFAAGIWFEVFHIDPKSGYPLDRAGTIYSVTALCISAGLPVLLGVFRAGRKICLDLGRSVPAGIASAAAALSAGAFCVFGFAECRAEYGSFSGAFSSEAGMHGVMTAVCTVAAVPSAVYLATVSAAYFGKLKKGSLVFGIFLAVWYFARLLMFETAGALNQNRWRNSIALAACVAAVLFTARIYSMYAYGRKLSARGSALIAVFCICTSFCAGLPSAVSYIMAGDLLNAAGSAVDGMAGFMALMSLRRSGKGGDDLEEQEMG
ncbi:MAG: hypothetical protein ACOX6J_01030 [Oscillospiraceae bacterium]|jgi:hypothetical protein